MQYSWGGGNAADPTIGIRDGDTGDRYGDYQRVGFDCSGLTSYVAARCPPQAVGRPEMHRPQQVSWDHALPGDLVGDDGHITIYLGVIDGQRMQLESPQSAAAGSPHDTHDRHPGNTGPDGG